MYLKLTAGVGSVFRLQFSIWKPVNSYFSVCVRTRGWYWSHWVLVVVRRSDLDGGRLSVALSRMCGFCCWPCAAGAGQLPCIIRCPLCFCLWLACVLFGVTNLIETKHHTHRKDVDILRTRNCWRGENQFLFNTSPSKAWVCSYQGNWQGSLKSLCGKCLGVCLPCAVPIRMSLHLEMGSVIHCSGPSLLTRVDELLVMSVLVFLATLGVCGKQHVAILLETSSHIVDPLPPLLKETKPVVLLARGWGT